MALTCTRKTDSYFCGFRFLNNNSLTGPVPQFIINSKENL